MADLGSNEYSPITILDVLQVDLCANAILEHVAVADLVRSERVSRRWQRAVTHYLRTCGTLSFAGFHPDSREFDTVLTLNHQTISILNKIDFLPNVCKALDKWGPYVTRMITDFGEKEYLDIILSRCPHLKQIELKRSSRDKQRRPSLAPLNQLKEIKQIVLNNIYGDRGSKYSDVAFGYLFQAINCENITIRDIGCLTGSFVKSLRADRLKSLSLTGCSHLRTSNLMAISKMRNLTSLELNQGHELNKVSSIHLILLEKSQLKDLTLSLFIFSEEWIQAFSRLGNLKRLTLYYTRGGVTDAFMEGLARGCRKLEYLKIMGNTHHISTRGVTALCRRSPSARTTLHFPINSSLNDVGCSWLEDDFERHFLRHFLHVRLYRELAKLGCVQLTREWLLAACRDPRGRELPLNPSAGSPAEDQKSLKLIIF